MNTLIEILSPDFLLRDALLNALVVGAVCPLVGVYFLLRRLIFLGVALPQVSAAGIALAFMIFRFTSATHDHGDLSEESLALIGSIILTVAALGAFVWGERSRSTTSDGRIGAVYVLAAALTILFLATDPQGEAEMVSILKGDVLATTSRGLAITSSIYLLVAAVIIIFRKQFFLLSFDRELGQVFRMKIFWWDALLYLIFGVTIAVGVKAVGPIVVFGFLVVPALAARSLSSTMSMFCILASVIGFSSAFLGFWAAYTYDLPLGPTEVVVACLMLLAALLFRFVRRIAASQSSFSASGPAV